MAFCLGLTRGELGAMLGQLPLVTLFGARLDLRTSLGELLQPFLAPRQFVRDRHAVRKVSLVRRFGLRHEFSDFGLQLRLDLARMLVRQRAVLAGVGVDLRAVQRDCAHLKQAHLARQKQNLHEQRLDLLQKTPPERRDGVVIGMFVRRNEAESHRIIRRPLQLAAGKHARGVAVDQNAQAAAADDSSPSPSRDRRCSSPIASRPSMTSTTKRARCFSGSHSSTDGGRRNPVWRSIVRKLLIGQRSKGCKNHLPNLIPCRRRL